VHRPSRAEVRAGGVGLAFFSGSALLILLTTEPPAGKYYPWWAFALAGVGIVIGLVALFATLFWPETKSTPEEELVLRIADGILKRLEANLELSKQGLQDQTKAPPNVIERAIHGLEAEAKISVRGDRITRRETVYDETGRVAGEEIVHESGARDAKAFPETVAAKADVPTPTVIGGTSPLSATPEFPKGAISQDTRPGWRAWSEIDPQQGHGAVLKVESLGEGATVFRCRVTSPDSGAVDWTKRSTKSPTKMRVHYPLAFSGAAPPLLAGEYRFSWFGYVEGNPSEVFLAENTFKVNEMGQVYPKKDGPKP
jgi:hypothetical protein